MSPLKPIIELKKFNVYEKLLSGVGKVLTQSKAASL